MTDKDSKLYNIDRTSSAGYMTNWAARLFARAMDRRLKPLGLSTGHLPIFFALGAGGALSQKALTEYAAIEQPTMAATLSRMERDGLIHREPDANDRRSMLISLTPLALEKLPAVREAIETLNEKALGALSEEERDAFLVSLAKIVAALADDD
ncbi:MarR family transcriptional regulator [Rhodomicrobium udaipurense JA643]|uniref:MarR family transcriptional regulator n=1 Tax=Rhodomicrobium udaipurense TaxID=1202716 RepID=A0A8I1KKE0_9HYPH|nr:MarR family transcriptional regulator [Rhodomicrobium udaipurense]KAI93468.1 MarR family transcriptional regulator [Rhodomicrobium udaipurense JA643]MBJ7543939.1 MarR family transcriptional regulator [Rhodomicrobium udaipurense]